MRLLILLLNLLLELLGFPLLLFAKLEQGLPFLVFFGYRKPAASGYERHDGNHNENANQAEAVAPPIPLPAKIKICPDK